MDTTRVLIGQMGLSRKVCKSRAGWGGGGDLQVFLMFSRVLPSGFIMPVKPSKMLAIA